jgi:hypothetical protein
VLYCLPDNYTTCLPVTLSPTQSQPQANLIIQLLRGQLQAKGHHWVEVTQQAQHTFNQELQRRLKGTVWLSGCKSWYLLNPAKGSSSSSGGISGGGTSGSGSDGSGTQQRSGDSGSNQGQSAAAAGADASSQVGLQAAGDDSSGSDSSSGGVVMWPGLVSEFWQRTVRPVGKDWLSGKAAHPVGGAGGGAAQQGKVLRKETPLQQLLGSVGVWTEEKKGA